MSQFAMSLVVEELHVQTPECYIFYSEEVGQ